MLATLHLLTTMKPGLTSTLNCKMLKILSIAWQILALSNWGSIKHPIHIKKASEIMMIAC